jgi:hypothetical protein
MDYSSYSSHFELFAALNFAYFALGGAERLQTINLEINVFYHEHDEKIKVLLGKIDFYKGSLEGRKDYLSKLDNKSDEKYQMFANLFKIQFDREIEDIPGFMKDLDKKKVELEEFKEKIDHYKLRTKLPETFIFCSVYSALYCVIVLLLSPLKNEFAPDLYNLSTFVFNILSVSFILMCLFVFKSEEWMTEKHGYLKSRGFFFNRKINFPRTILWKCFIICSTIGIVLVLIYFSAKLVEAYFGLSNERIFKINLFVSVIIPMLHFAFHLVHKVYIYFIYEIVKRPEHESFLNKYESTQTDIEKTFTFLDFVLKHSGNQEYIIKKN